MPTTAQFSTWVCCTLVRTYYVAVRGEMNLDNGSSDDEFFGKQEEEEEEGRVTVFPVNESTSSRTILEGQDNIINHESLSCREWKAQETNFRCVIIIYKACCCI